MILIYIAFITSFIPCLFEGFEMSMFSYIATSDNKKSGNYGTVYGIIIVLLMNYLTYYFLPLLITDTFEYYMKLILGIIFIILASSFFFFDYPSSSNSFFTALIGISAEGIEVDLFSVSSYFMTGDLIPAFLGGISGFLIVLLMSKIIYFKFNKDIMRKIAITILYTVGFIILTSGLV